MPFDVVFLAELFAAPGTPDGSCPRVGASTCSRRGPTPAGAVSRGSAFAVAVSPTRLAVAIATTPTRRQILIAPLLAVSERTSYARNEGARNRSRRRPA